MTKTTIALFIAMLSVIAVSGCTSQETVAFAGGTDGLKLSFADLPATIFADVNFRLAVLVQNAGEASIPIGNATFTLNNAQSVGVSNPIRYNTINMTQAKRINDTIIPGNQELISWTPAKFSGAVLTEQQKIPLSVDACYLYSTKILATVCIAKTNKICNPVEDKPVQSSGAPIQATKFSQIAQTNESNGDVVLNIALDVAKKGKGDVYLANACCVATASCLGLTTDKIDQITLLPSTVKIGNRNYPTYCDELSLLDDKGTTSCTITIPAAFAATDFEDELELTLSYVFKQRLTTELTVIPVKTA